MQRVEFQGGKMQRNSCVGRHLGYVRSGLGRNALRRPTDRLEALVCLGLYALAVVATVMTIVAAITVTSSLSERAFRESADRYTVQAVVVTKAPTRENDPLSTTSPAGSVPVPVHWRTIDGSWRFGHANVELGTPAGSTTKVWLDRAGDQVAGPLTHSEAVIRGIAVGLGRESAAVLVLWLAGFAARRLFDRSRLADWERAWVSADARWRGHGHQNPRT